MCSTHSFRPANNNHVANVGEVVNEDRPHTAEELRMMKENLDKLRLEFFDKENELLKKIHKAQDAIRADIKDKQEKKKHAGVSDVWQFEQTCNGWI